MLRAETASLMEHALSTAFNDRLLVLSVFIALNGAFVSEQHGQPFSMRRRVLWRALRRGEKIYITSSQLWKEQG